MKLVDQKKRNEIYNSKKLLKGSGLVIKEDLTYERVKILEEASKRFSIANTWTKNGKVFAKVEGKIINIFSTEYLKAL